MNQNNRVQIRSQDDEYNQVRKDLIFVIALNIIFFALLFGLYYFNQATGRVDAFFSQILKF